MNKLPHILICDDDPVVHESLGLYLSYEGYPYTSAYDGEDALKHVESDHPDLMVLDLMMPKKSGIDPQGFVAAHNHAHGQRRGDRPHTGLGAGRG